jgi:putative spermidine/putrescine transport system ATP-binding protein/putrescine transport system ATP-binding protein
MSVVELSGVTKRFGDFVAVSDMSFVMEKGSILSLLGPSGCGKTTTLRMISGFEEPDEGRILISGQDMKGKRPYERNVGLLFQDYALFPHLTVSQNVAYGLKRRGYERGRIPARVAEMLELVKLTGFEGRRPGQLSGGQQQRVALARALAISPEVVLLDEPLSALDAKLRQELRLELKQILGAVDATTIVVTHDQEEAMSLGDSVIVMSEGRIMQEGLPTDIYADPKTKFVAEFIGRSNWFSGRLGERVAEGVRRFDTAEGLGLLVTDPDGAATDADGYEVCIRPERIHTADAAAQPASADGAVNRLRGTVRDVAHLGADIHLVIELEAGRSITATEQYLGQTLEQAGEAVDLTFRPQDCIIVPAGS